LSELFSGSHPILTQAYYPMTIRFFILQSHYRSTLDFSNDALQASEKALKRLWEAYENLGKLALTVDSRMPADMELEATCKKLIAEFDEFMDDDFNTAKVLANLFELVPTINAIKNKQLNDDVLSKQVIELMQQKFKVYLEDIFGLKSEGTKNEQLDGIIQLLINIRKEAKAKKDFVTSDTIRKELINLGVQLKDEKDGSVSYSFN
jgi:cysteinyl-tRNA synthetase